MTSITYRPTTQGQTFGNPGSVFDSAAKSLNRATTGLSDAFDTFRQGSIDARDQRTQDAIAAIKAAQTPDQYAQLAQQYASPDSVLSDFGQIDINAFNKALRNQKGVARDAATADFEYQQGLKNRADIAALNRLNAELYAKSDQELQNLARDPSFVEGLGLNNPYLGVEALQKAINQRNLAETRRLNRTKIQLDIAALQNAANEATRNKQEATQLRSLYTTLLDQNPDGISESLFMSSAIENNIDPEKAAKFIKSVNAPIVARQEATQQDIKQLESTLKLFDTEDDLLGAMDSSRVEAERAVAALQNLNVPVTQINRLLKQSLGGEDDFEPNVTRNFIRNLEESATRADLENRANAASARYLRGN